MGYKYRLGERSFREVDGGMPWYQLARLTNVMH